MKNYEKALREGSLLIRKAWLQKESQVSVLFSQIVERPVGAVNTSEMSPMQKLREMRSRLVGAAQGNSTRPVTYLHSFAVEKVADLIDYAAEKDAAVDYFQTDTIVDGNAFLASLGYDECEILIIETANYDDLEYSNTNNAGIRYLHDDEAAWQKHVLDKFVKKTSANASPTGEQFYMFSDGLPIYRWTEIKEINNPDFADISSMFVEHTHEVSLAWSFELDEEATKSLSRPRGTTTKPSLVPKV